MDENKVKVWLARDEDGWLGASPSKPKKDKDHWSFCDYYIHLESYMFSSVKWEDDEPTEAYITLAKQQEKKEIDWEQRRYEIVKSIAAAIYSRPTVKTALLNVNQIISAADALINELKNQSDEL